MEEPAKRKHNVSFWKVLIRVISIFLIVLLGSQVLFVLYMKFTNYCEREEGIFGSDLLKLVSKLQITFNPEDIEDFGIQNPKNVDEYMITLAPEYKRARENYKRLAKMITTEILLRLSNKPELLEKIFKRELTFNRGSIKDLRNNEELSTYVDSLSIGGIFIPGLEILISENKKIQKDFLSLKKNSVLFIGLKNQNESKNSKSFSIHPIDSGFENNIFLKEDETLKVMQILLIVKIEQKRFISNSEVKYTFEFIDPATRQSLSTLKVKGLENFLRN